MNIEKQIVSIIKGLQEETALTDKRVKQLYDLIAGASPAGIIPVGAVIPYLGGYMTDGANGGFTMVMAAANTVAAVNTLLNPDNFHVCNGALLNDGGPIFSAAGRYLPLITDDRFFMGDTLAGGSGGSSTMAHTHEHSHTHYHDHGAFYCSAAPTSFWNWEKGDHALVLIHETHYHSINVPGKTSDAPNESTTGAASNTENRPKYLSCFYIMRTK